LHSRGATKQHTEGCGRTSGASIRSTRTRAHTSPHTSRRHPSGIRLCCTCATCHRIHYRSCEGLTCCNPHEQGDLITCTHAWKYTSQHTHAHVSSADEVRAPPARFDRACVLAAVTAIPVATSGVEVFGVIAKPVADLVEVRHITSDSDIGLGSAIEVGATAPKDV